MISSILDKIIMMVVASLFFFMLFILFTVYSIIQISKQSGVHGRGDGIEDGL